VRFTSDIPRRSVRRVRRLAGKALRHLRAARRPALADDRSTWFHDHYVNAVSQVESYLGGQGINLAGKRVADIGTGDGIIALGVANRLRPALVVGYDIRLTDTAALEQEARDRGVCDALPTNLVFEQSSADGIPASSASFDVVLSWSAFEHIADPGSVLTEIRRIMRPDGVFMLQLWPFYYSEHGSHLWPWFEGETFVQFRRSEHEILGILERAHAEEMLHQFPTLNRVTLDELQSAMHAAGLRVACMELLSNNVALPPEVEAEFPLSQLGITGVKLIAVPSS
jgi:ubiquinone/menaquinone biosynthesis C-methylase UbiE